MTKSMGIKRAFTQDDLARARALYGEMKNYKAVARVMDRSPSVIRDWLIGARGARRVKKDKRPSSATVHIPSHVLADRDRRMALQPRDITAAFFGDPLPGESYLERR